MKIGFDVAQTCSERAGCAWYADSLIRTMVKHAPQHHYFLYHQFGDWINSSTENGTRIRAENVTPTFQDVSPQEANRIWASPDELVIKTGAPDIVHANSFRAPKVPGAKLVFTVYDVSFWAKPEYTTEDNRIVCQQGLLEALGNADGFVFISQSARDEFESFLPGWMNSHHKPWAVTPLAPRHARPIGERSTRVGGGEYWLAVGSLEPRKNYHGLLDAYEIYQSAGGTLPLKIAGGVGWKSDDVRARINAMNAHGAVEHLGYVTDEELTHLYLGARALVFPSFYEGFGLPPLEAMTYGCPVICSSVTSLREVGGSAVIYIDPNDPLQIANSMHQLETDDALCTQLIQTGLDQAATFSWERTASITLEFYSRLLNSPSNNSHSSEIHIFPE